MRARRLLYRLFELLTFMNMPIRQKFTLFAIGVSLWFLVIGLLGAFSMPSSEFAALVAAELVAHALLILFAISITRSLTGPIDGMIHQIRVLTKGNLDHMAHIQVASGDEVGEMSVRFNQLLDSLQDIATFRKVIEADDTSLDVYSRLGHAFDRLGLPKHRVFAADRMGKGLQVVFDSSGGEGWCGAEILGDASLCRAHRTGTTVGSFAFPGVCRQFCARGAEHVCIPLMLGGASAGAVQFVFDTPNRVAGSTPDAVDGEQARARVELAERYLKEALPVLETRRLTETLREQSLRDPLTGLFNRRYVAECQGTISALATRRGTSVGVLMCDIDHFKAVNDVYGHDAGDIVLRTVAQTLLRELRRSDVLARFGGEEFLAILPDATAESIGIAAERLRRGVAECKIVVGGEDIRKTISIGVAVFPTDGESFSQCVKLADAALYVAKESGRDRVVMHSRPPATYAVA